MNRKKRSIEAKILDSIEAKPKGTILNQAWCVTSRVRIALRRTNNEDDITIELQAVRQLCLLTQKSILSAWYTTRLFPLRPFVCLSRAKLFNPGNVPISCGLTVIGVVISEKWNLFLSTKEIPQFRLARQLFRRLDISYYYANLWCPNAITHRISEWQDRNIVQHFEHCHIDILFNLFGRAWNETNHCLDRLERITALEYCGQTNWMVSEMTNVKKWETEDSRWRIMSANGGVPGLEPFDLDWMERAGWGQCIYLLL